MPETLTCGPPKRRPPSRHAGVSRPRRTANARKYPAGTVWVAILKAALATPITGKPSSACMRAQAGTAAGQGRRSRQPPGGSARSGRRRIAHTDREFTKIELTRPVRRTSARTSVRSATTSGKRAAAAATAAARAPRKPGSARPRPRTRVGPLRRPGLARPDHGSQPGSPRGFLTGSAIADRAIAATLRT
jgi:hypothetical protein